MRRCRGSFLQQADLPAAPATAAQAGAARLDEAVVANLRGLGYG